MAQFTDQQILDYISQNMGNPALPGQIQQLVSSGALTLADIARSSEGRINEGQVASFAGLPAPTPPFQAPSAGLLEALVADPSNWRYADDSNGWGGDWIGQGPNPRDALEERFRSGADVDMTDPRQVGLFMSQRNIPDDQREAFLRGLGVNTSDAAFMQQLFRGWSENEQRLIGHETDMRRELQTATSIFAGVVGAGAAGLFDAAGAAGAGATDASSAFGGYGAGETLAGVEAGAGGLSNIVGPGAPSWGTAVGDTVTSMGGGGLTGLSETAGAGIGLTPSGAGLAGFDAATGLSPLVTGTAVAGEGLTAANTSAAALNAANPVPGANPAASFAPPGAVVPNITGATPTSGAVPVPPGTPGTPGAPAATPTPNPNNFLNPDGSMDWARFLAAFGPAALGAYASNEQTRNLRELADRSWAAGEPSRGRYEGSYAPGFTMANDPGFTDMITQGSQGVLAGLSRSGNPYGNPSAITSATDTVTRGLAYPALQDYRRMNAGTGALATIAAGAPGQERNAIDSGANTWNALGSGLSNFMNPPQRITGYDQTTGRFTYGI